MATETVTPDMKKAAALAVIELLIQPEYGERWLREEVVEATVTDTSVTDEVVEQVGALVDSRLKEFAKSLLTELDEESRAIYEKNIFSE